MHLFIYLFIMTVEAIKEISKLASFGQDCKAKNKEKIWRDDNIVISVAMAK